MSKKFGPFRIGESIGAGGMSEVFAATHHASGEAVAIKVTRFREEQTSLQRAFTAELAAMARMYHPGIVRIHDWGRLPDDDGNWCAMDLADLGALDVSMIRDWKGLRDVLTQVLLGLAHAHSRGIVHRDLKPQNILVFGDLNAPVYRIADFGLAHSRFELNPDALTGAVAGTPAYMAPEQLHGRWREYGPWTDLYAVGCIAFELARGKPPFRGNSPLKIALAHVQGERPELVTRFAVPDGFEQWIDGLMQRDWVSRVGSAALALSGLDALGEVESDTSPDWSTASVVALTMDFDDITQQLDVPTLADDDVPTMLAETLAQMGFALPDVTPGVSSDGQEDVSLPDDWRVERTTSTRFEDTGSKLISMRQTPVVGHDQTRDAIWKVLRQSIHEQRSAVVLVEGGSGRERAMIGRWLLERVRECSTVETVHLRADVAQYGRDPFEETLSELLSCRGLSDDRLTEHLGRILSRYVQAPYSLAQRLAPIFDVSEPAAKRRVFARAGLWEFLDETARVRPVLLHIAGLGRDHILWSLIERIQRVNPGALVVVATLINGDWLRTDTEVRVREHAQTSVTRPQSLNEQAIEYVLDSYIRLAPELRKRWLDVAKEDLGVAMDCVRYGALMGALVPTPDGHTLYPGVNFPQSAQQLVEERIIPLRRHFPAALRALTVAAAAGSALSFDEWTDAMKVVGADLEDSSVSVLMRHGFIREIGGRYEFENPDERQFLVRQLLAEDRANLIESCDLSVLDEALLAAELYLVGDVPQKAAECLIAVMTSPKRSTMNLSPWLITAERILNTLDEPTELLGWIPVAETICRRVENDFGSSKELLELIRRPEVQQTPRALLELRIQSATSLAYEGHFERGLEEATEVLDALGDTDARYAQATGVVGWILMAMQRYEDAGAVLRAGLKNALEFEAWADATGVCVLLPFTILDDPERSLGVFEQAIEFALKSGDEGRYLRVLLERCLTLLEMGEFDSALRNAEVVWRLGPWARPGQLPLVGVNLAVCRAKVGDRAGAKEAIEQTAALSPETPELRDRQRHGTYCVISAIMHDTEEWDRLVASRPPPRATITALRYIASSAWKEVDDSIRAEQAMEYLGDEFQI